MCIASVLTKLTTVKLSRINKKPIYLLLFRMLLKFIYSSCCIDFTVYSLLSTEKLKITFIIKYPLTDY